MFSTGIDNKFGLEAVFYGMGFLAYIVVVLLFIDLFFTSITSPIFYGIFAPNKRRRRRRRRSVGDSFDRRSESNRLINIFEGKAENELSRMVDNITLILDAIETFQKGIKG